MNMGFFGNAFSSPDASKTSPSIIEEEELLFERIAGQVVSRGLTTPVILFLEMHRPLSFVAGQFLHGLGPFASVLVSERDIELLAQSLSRRDGIDRLIQAVENADAAADKPPATKIERKE